MGSNHGLSRFESALRLRIEWLATLVLTWLVGDVGPNRISVFSVISFFIMGLLRFDIDSQGYLRLDEVSSNVCCPDLCQNSVLEIPLLGRNRKRSIFLRETVLNVITIRILTRWFD